MVEIQELPRCFERCAKEVWKFLKMSKAQRYPCFVFLIRKDQSYFVIVRLAEIAGHTRPS
jgi:hypothetical protein